MRGRIKQKSVSYALRRGEMLLDSAFQSTTEPLEVRMKKVAVALAYFRVVRQWFKENYGWDWTLTSPPKEGATDEELRARFGYLEPKRWHYNPTAAMKVRVTRKEEKEMTTA